MSSQGFEDAEYDLEDVLSELSSMVQSLANMSGEQRRRQIEDAQSRVDKAEDLLYTMESEARLAPPRERATLNNRLTSHRQKLKSIKQKLATGERSALLGAGGSQDQGAVTTRDQILANRQTMNATSDRLVQIERLGESSRQTGEQIMTDLSDQRDTIVRIGGRVQGTDANLSKANRILNSMTRRIMTHKMIMVATIAILILILVVVLLKKLHVI
ncbi:hypothetical protein PTSG_05416 [Salpingoeca rosetta]|uniref:t-SNARE coiled-coil homology domain-containing protein n=1 Tax=Salpingoeca rosetta (strain ATCC 50818 / BSB-021) TaxID=946362 RepID=F2UAD4_SALR5|nr:uncharacterized protein PTSG_05416 [Salpingoeca rosetta]EGD73709.1 hypothetical protein PTSG_05416 [Salpingoeca rosetta]|eukprot:XP_004993990.1 hypothetical protein PTSG_05416 [Salpingoeca rosetta]